MPSGDDPEDYQEEDLQIMLAFIAFLLFIIIMILVLGTVFIPATLKLLRLENFPLWIL